ncbi:MAG: phage head closure protein [Hyphomicrobiales bacterium]
MAAGALRALVVFERKVTGPDGAGGQSVEWGAVYSCRGKLMPARGREQIEAGRMEASLAAVLRVRSSVDGRGLTEADRVRINDVVYQIRSISNPDQRNRYLELSVERGTGT